MTTIDTLSMVMPKSADSIINELIYESKIVGTMCTIGKNGAKFVAMHNIEDRFHTGYGDHPDEAKANADEATLKYLASQNILTHQQLASYALYRLGKDWPTVAVIASNAEQGDLRSRLDELYWNTVNARRRPRSPDSASSETGTGSKKRKLPSVSESFSGSFKQEPGSDQLPIQPTLAVNETEETGSSGSAEKLIKQVPLPSNAEEMHPSVLLTKMRPGLRIHDRRVGDEWVATVDIDGQEFIVNAETKREARMLVCKYVCQEFFGVDSKYTLNGQM